MVDNFEGAVLPWRCLCCGAPGSAGLDLCAACHAELPWNANACGRCALPLSAGASTCGECQRDPPPFAAAFAPLRYAFPIDRLIVGLKFGGHLEHGRLLGTLVTARSEALRAAIPPGLPLLPIPLHAARLAERGFNQAAELARIVAPALGAKPAPELAWRRKPTPPQARLDAASRRANLAGAFAVSAHPKGCAATWVPRRLIILDDVVTTGATVRELSRTLRDAGCEEVFVVAVARAGRVPPVAAGERRG
jgi:predicted amidophosphoribosyltransferase